MRPTLLGPSGAINGESQRSLPAIIPFHSLPRALPFPQVAGYMSGRTAQVRPVRSTSNKTQIKSSGKAGCVVFTNNMVYSNARVDGPLSKQGTSSFNWLV